MSNNLIKFPIFRKILKYGKGEQSLAKLREAVEAIDDAVMPDNVGSFK
jgi:hypothetical protein